MKENLRCIVVLVGVLFASVLLGPSPATAGTNEDLGILPVDGKVFGGTYGDWAAEWWKWAIGVPAATNPILDSTGEFGGVDQRGPVWFLAGTFGGKAERAITVPERTWIFFSAFNAIWWSPEDLEAAALVAEEVFGLNPAELTDEELIRLIAAYSVEGLNSLRITIDGVRVEDPEQYRASSPRFMIIDTDLFDDLEIPISRPNLAIADGYWIMLAPLSPGEHVISFSSRVDSPVFGPFKVDVTVHLTVQ